MGTKTEEKELKVGGSQPLDPKKNAATPADGKVVKNRFAKRGYYVLSDAELSRLAAYKYTPGSYTVIDNAMTPYWTACANLLPRWLAPNMVTFLGLLIVAGATAILVGHYSPDFDSQVPSWIYLCYAISMFFYQTMDAIDGKHARRTNSASPLGQLFDHGCDTVVTLLCVLGVAAGMRFGANWKTMLLFTNIELAFYLAQWEEYHTGTLNWSNGWYGVTESQLTQMLLFLITFVTGEDFWQRRLPYFDAPGYEAYTIINLLLIMFTLVTSSMFFTSLRHVAACGPDHLPADLRGNKTTGLQAGLIQLIPVILVLTMGFLLGVGPGQEAFVRHPALQLLGMGTIITHITSRMIIHHMAKQKLLLEDLMCPSILALFLLTINTYWAYLGFGKHPPVHRDLALSATFGLALVNYLYYICGTVRDICRFLNVRCFHIRWTKDE